MKIFALSIISCSLFLAGCQQAGIPAAPVAAIPAGVTLVKDASKPAAAVAIPYKKYQLANGLTVIVH